jgi:uracil phosphoribosyltransferase
LIPEPPRRTVHAHHRHLVDHPLVATRSPASATATLPNALFRTNLERIGTLLLAEATRELPTVDGTVETPLTTAPVRGSRCSP